MPSTPYPVELAQLFHVSVDYLLGLSRNQALDLAGLTPREVALLAELAACFRQSREADT